MKNTISVKCLGGKKKKRGICYDENGSKFYLYGKDLTQCTWSKELYYFFSA